MRKEFSILEHCTQLAQSYMKNPKMFDMLARCGGPRGMMAWGYQIRVTEKTLLPIKQAPHETKTDLWTAACEYELTHVDRIEWCKAVYFILGSM